MQLGEGSSGESEGLLGGGGVRIRPYGGGTGGAGGGGRSPAGWAASIFVGSLIGGLLVMSALQHLYPSVSSSLAEVDLPLEMDDSRTPQQRLRQQQRADRTAALTAAVVAALNYTPGDAGAAGGGGAAGAPGAQDWALVEGLLKESKQLQDKLAGVRRTALWEAKAKTSELKTLLQGIKARQDTIKMTFFLDDAALAAIPEEDKARVLPGGGLNWDAPGGVAVGREDEWQEVDQPMKRPQGLVTVWRLRAALQGVARRQHWGGAVQACADAIEHVEAAGGRELVLVRQQEAAAAADVALTERVLARIKKGEEAWKLLAEQWQEAAHSAQGRAAAFLAKGGEQEPPEQRSLRNEFALWATLFKVEWGAATAAAAAEAPATSQPNAGDAGAAPPLVPLLEQVMAALEWRLQGAKEAATALAAKREAVHGDVKKAEDEVRRSCGQAAEWLVDGGGQLGVCASRLRVEHAKEESAGNAVGIPPLVPPPLAPAYEWRRADPAALAAASAPRSLLTGPAVAAASAAAKADAAAAQKGESKPLPPPPSVNVSFLLYTRWPHEVVNFTTDLYQCTHGLDGAGLLGPGFDSLGDPTFGRLSAEVLVAVRDIPGDGADVAKVLDDLQNALSQLSGWVGTDSFVTQVMVVGPQVAAPQALNMLGELARGEFLVVIDTGMVIKEPVVPKPCDWLAALLRPLRLWPTAGVVGMMGGQMGLQGGAWDQLSVWRSALDQFFNRLRDPEYPKSRIQFLIGQVNGPLAFRRSAFLGLAAPNGGAGGGPGGGAAGRGAFVEVAGAGSDMLFEYDVCRRLWMGGWSVVMAYGRRYEWTANLLEQPRRVTAEGEWMRNTFPTGTSPWQWVDLRITSEMKRQNRLLKPLQIWE